MQVQDAKTGWADSGLYTIEANFFTETLVIRGELTGPDARLSDHLNSTQSNITMRPLQVRRIGTSRPLDVADSWASVAKAHILFILPITEPTQEQGPANPSWVRTTQRPAWAAVNGYTISGKVHVEAHADPKMLLRSFENKRFLPLTEATLTFPDDEVRDYAAIIVNRERLEAFVLRSGA